MNSFQVNDQMRMEIDKGKRIVKALDVLAQNVPKAPYKIIFKKGEEKGERIQNGKGA